MAIEMVTLPADAIADLRRTLTIGLAALAEVERVRDVANSYADLPDGLMPVHPSGCHEIGEFANAFTWLENATKKGG